MLFFSLLAEIDGINKMFRSVNNEKERKKANGFVEFSNINSITAKKSKSEQNKFILNVNNGKSKDTRDIMFRCDTEKVKMKCCLVLSLFVDMWYT